ncbi:hypothetical protein RXV86_13815 [Alisedimentitalea sp. MJ-SS2]|uniref:hypothetical protein n=1 Tax=Aliisedimentitalea sp. MJ-SS2 TaxID=3049795 RepID=UPI002911AAF1|nr:hypothetical protein [Alisedimentitalea sp. MJ-SS2]MDU8928462.1 hypothetical protein [Alisedimentitalea sp. MJ-SS2]
MNELGKLVTRFCEQYFNGLKPACDAAGLKYTTLHAQIAHEREIPFSTVERLTSAAGVSLEVFRRDRAEIGVAAIDVSDTLHKRAAAAYSQALRDVQTEMRRNGTDIICDDVLNWLHRNGGRLTDFDALRERVDLFHKYDPNDNIMRPHHIGASSLVAKCFDISDLGEYTPKIGQLGRTVIDNSIASHLRVQKTQQYQVEDIRLQGKVDSSKYDIEYRRIMAPVTTMDGSEFTLVFAQPL